MARVFNGSSDYVSTNAASGCALAFANDQKFSACCWVYFTALNVRQEFIARGFDGSVTPWELQLVATGSLRVESFNTGTGEHFAGSPTVLSTNTWIHFYGDYDGGTWHTAVNGTIDASSIDVHGPQASTTSVFTYGAVYTSGFGTSTPGDFLGGGLAEIGVFDKPLAPQEIKQLARGKRVAQVQSARILANIPLNDTVPSFDSPASDLGPSKFKSTLHGSSLVAGPPLLLRPAPITLVFPTVAPPASPIKFRKTLSPIGTRAGSRQMHVT